MERIEWKAASNGTGKRHWFVCMVDPNTGRQIAQHRDQRGRLVRYGSHEAADLTAHRLNMSAIYRRGINQQRATA